MVIAYGQTLDAGDMTLQALDHFAEVLEPHLIVRHQIEPILLFHSHKLFRSDLISERLLRLTAASAVEAMCPILQSCCRHASSPRQ